MIHFSEVEGKVPKPIELIDERIWRGIVGIINDAIRNDALSKCFPLQCPDGNGVCGFDENLFRDLLRAEVPNIEYPFQSIGNISPFEDEKIQQERLQNEQYAVLDTIEFVFDHLNDSIKDPRHFHEYFHHYELVFVDGNDEKDKFRTAINELFRRNGVQFILSEKGRIVRVLPPGIAETAVKSSSTKDVIIHDYISFAIDRFHSPRLDERKIGLERLWDAFERIKTAYRPDLSKKESIEALICAVSLGNETYKNSITNECICLTEIGNSYQIRHHEVDKVPIDNGSMVDYFFTRMLATIDLLLTVFPT